MGLKDSILALTPETREVETAAGTVLVRGITLAAKDAIQRAAAEGLAWRGILLLHCCLDPATKQPLFAASDLDGLNALPQDLECIVDAALELSAMKRLEVEELEGNSERTPNSDTVSSLRAS